MEFGFLCASDIIFYCCTEDGMFEEGDIFVLVLFCFYLLCLLWVDKIEDGLFDYLESSNNF